MQIFVQVFMQNLYRLSNISVRIYTSYCSIGLVLKMRNAKGKKIYTSQIRTIEIYTRLVCGWGEIYTSQYKYEACIKRKNYKEMVV